MFRNRNFGPRWRTDDALLPDYNVVSSPVAETLGEEVVWLHHRALLGDEEHLAGVVDALNRVRVRASSGVGIS